MYIDTHAHLDGEEFKDDLDAVIQRAHEAGCQQVFVPAIDIKSSEASLELARRYSGFCYAMVGLHPEEVRADWKEQLEKIHSLLTTYQSPITSPTSGQTIVPFSTSTRRAQRITSSFSSPV